MKQFNFFLKFLSLLMLLFFISCNKQEISNESKIIDNGVEFLFSECDCFGCSITLDSIVSDSSFNHIDLYIRNCDQPATNYYALTENPCGTEPPPFSIIGTPLSLTMDEYEYECGDCIRVCINVENWLPGCQETSPVFYYNAYFTITCSQKINVPPLPHVVTVNNSFTIENARSGTNNCMVIADNFYTLCSEDRP